uniref:Uncharacterized protein n=1 Tax=Anguilla anguilla TaxID=7936 RepID=A0A0E9UPR4_ANGAN
MAVLLKCPLVLTVVWIKVQFKEIGCLVTVARQRKC